MHARQKHAQQLVISYNRGYVAAFGADFNREGVFRGAKKGLGRGGMMRNLVAFFVGVKRLNSSFTQLVESNYLIHVNQWVEGLFLQFANRVWWLLRAAGAVGLEQAPCLRSKRLNEFFK